MLARLARSSMALAGLLALAGVLCASGLAKAETVYIKNDTDTAVFVSVSTVVSGKVVREKPVLVAGGKTAVINVSGNKVVQITDAKTSRGYYDGIIPSSKSDQSFTFEIESGKGKLK